jgi:type II secretory pathway component PulM
VSELWGRLQAVWDNLSTQERLLLSTLAVFVGGILVFVALINPILSASADARARVEAAENDLEVMVRLRREYETINARLVGVEQRIKDNRDKQNTLTLLESLASSAAVKIDSMEERKSPDHELYRETRVEVALKNVTLTQVVSLLHSIESSPRQFSVKGLRIKTRADKDDTLEVNFTVSSFEAI